MSNADVETPYELTADRLADDTLTREEVLTLLRVGIQEAARKVNKGRVRDEEKEKVRIKWVRVLGYIGRAYADVLDDLESQMEIEERLAELETQLGDR